jgi:uncharacterized protein (TIGR02118 family)
LFVVLLVMAPSSQELEPPANPGRFKELKKVEVARPMPGPTGAPSPYHIVTELWFDSPDALKTITATPEWKAIMDDVPKFTAADAVTVIVSEVEPKR